MPSIPAGLSNVLALCFMSVSYKLFSSPAAQVNQKYGGHVMLCPVRPKAFPTPDGFCRSALFTVVALQCDDFSLLFQLIQVSPRSLGHNESKETPAPLRETSLLLQGAGNKDAEF